MDNYMDSIKICPLFAGIQQEDMKTALDCLGADKRQYGKNEFIFMAGSHVSSIGIVLSGSVQVIQEDFWGNRSILAGIDAGGLFGESFSGADMDKIPVSVVAVQPSAVLLMDYRRVTTSCSSACPFHLTLIENMLKILAHKNIMLTQKIEFLSRRTTRDKLLSYLSAQARLAGSSTFTIPFNRQELADYLSVERSAMSNELSKMCNDGILKYHRSQFELILYNK